MYEDLKRPTWALINAHYMESTDEAYESTDEEQFNLPADEEE
jgi:hypothetical protein